MKRIALFPMFRSNRLKRTFASLFLGLFAAVWAGLALAAEVIHSHSSFIEVLPDRSVIVTETIRVRAEGDDIKRGIWRYVPTKSKDQNGYTINHGLEVLAVLRDGEPDSWHLESNSGGEQIYIGDKDVFLKTGDYQYTLKYRMWRQVRDLKDNDELYWNATGNFWQFPISAAVAQVKLPQGANIINTTAYTGGFGSRDTDATISTMDNGNVVFRANNAFRPGEGMSIVVSFEKGVMRAPSQTEQMLNYISDRRALFLPLIAFLVVLGYFYTSWAKVGRDPQKGTIVPLFHPPQGLSPALIHYIHHFGWRQSGWTAFTAALLALATKGLVIIGASTSGKKTKITVTDKPAPELPVGELKLYTWFKSHGEVTIDRAVGKSLHEMHADFIDTIEEENRRAYFNRNSGYVFVGIALSALMIFAMLYFEVLHFGWVVASLVIGVIAVMISGILNHYRKAPKFSPFFFGFVIFSLTGNLGAGLFASLEFFDFAQFLNQDFFSSARNFVNEQPGAIAVLSIVAINIGFGLTMRAATVQGRKIMDQIDGFKMYLETAEKERLNYKDVPDMTVERFERLLPYAVALGVEKPWSEHFEKELARHAPTSERDTYNPTWHSGRGWRANRIVQNIASTATGVSAAMISAQPASSSSSGFSSGGGFSGGGGGGGGGGGW
jgi:uncharacterized membrane protein YgcG